MAHRVNFLLEDVVWGVLEKTPKGERSRIVNAALAQWFEKKRRADAALRMDELRAQLPTVSSRQIVKWVREDRERST